MQAGNAHYRLETDLPASVPVFPLEAALLLPGGRLPLNIFEPRYLQMLDGALVGDRLIGMIQPGLDGACKANGVDYLLVGGGVAANSRLRALAQERCDAAGIQLRVPRPGLCTDNGAMVAALGARLVAAGLSPSSLDLPADSSMPITEVPV